MSGRPTSHRLDWLRLPGLGRFLHWRHARLALQLPLLALAWVLVLHGLLGPQLAPRNLATLLTWVHYRGLLIVAVLLFGNVLCMGCPLLLPRELARRLSRPVRNFPAKLRGKWLAGGLFVGVLFAYELFDLWSSPRWTAILILGLFATALFVDARYRGAPFCKYVCPIGQFNFLASTLSPFEVKVRDRGTCDTCSTKDCIRGRPVSAANPVAQRGCELGLFLPRKVGNLDCTFCLDCVHACPEDNIEIASRVPGEELLDPRWRSGIGRLARRPDWIALAVIFCFAALLNAFGMVGPIYDLEHWMSDATGVRAEAPILGAIFVFALVVVPLALLLVTGFAALALGRSPLGIGRHLGVFVWTLVPIGLGVWSAHYSFHFLTGLWTFVPVAQSAAHDLGVAFLGDPDWGRGGLHESLVWPIEVGLLVLGWTGSTAAAIRLAKSTMPSHAWLGGLPWLALHTALLTTSLWLLAQPMEMRGTYL